LEPLASVVGAAVATAGFSVIIQKGVFKVLTALICSPLIGFVLSYFFMVALNWVFKKSTPTLVSNLFGRLQIISAAYMAFSHGSNDAQKTMGIITMALVSGGYSEKEIQREIGRFTVGYVDVRMLSDNKAVVYIDDKDVPAAIGKGGRNIHTLERMTGKKHEIIEYSEDPVQFIKKKEPHKKYTVLSWNALNRSWRSLLPRRLYSITSNTRSKESRMFSRGLWCWTTTTLKHGVVARFVCSLPIPKAGESGLIYSATLERRPKRCGLIYHGVQKTTSKPTHGFTAKGKKSLLSYIILTVTNSIDEKVVNVLEGKINIQQALLDALKL
jgi:hypothetical protein